MLKDLTTNVLRAQANGLTKDNLEQLLNKEFLAIGKISKKHNTSVEVVKSLIKLYKITVSYERSFGGKPPAPVIDLEKFKQLFEQGYDDREIAKVFGVKTTAVANTRYQHGLLRDRCTELRKSIEKRKHLATNV